MTKLIKYEFQSITIYPENGKKRRELDICSTFFCLLVILIHVLAEPVSLYRRDSLLYALVLGPWRLSSFVVQGFLFLAGIRMFLHHKSPEIPFSYKKYAYGRIRRVVLPYLVAVLLFTAYFFVSGTAPSSFGSWCLDILTGRLAGHFYYVPIICQFYILIPLWRRMAYRDHPVFSLLISFWVMLFCKLYLPDIINIISGTEFSDNALLFTTYLFYFTAGCFCGKYYMHFRVYLRQYTASIYVGWGICACINWFFILLNGRGIYYAPWLEVFHVLYCIYAILASMCLSEYIASKKNSFSTIWQSVSHQSYTIYLLHPLAIFFCNSLCTKLGIASLSLRLLIRTVFTYFFSLCILGFCKDRICIWFSSGKKKHTHDTTI